jgi:hypothetical protein
LCAILTSSTIIIVGAGWEVHRSLASKGRDTKKLAVLQGVPANPCHDVVVGAVILTGEHADANTAIICHHVVFDGDIEGVAICPSKSPQDVNAKRGGAGDGIMSDGGVADDVVIAQGEHKDPECLIPSDLVVGDGGVSDLGVGPGARQVGDDVDAMAGVLHYQVLGDSGMGNQGAWRVACYHEDAVKLGFCQDIVYHPRMRDSSQVGHIPSTHQDPDRKMLYPQAPNGVVTGKDKETSRRRDGEHRPV